MDNNIIFSLVISIISAISFYFISDKGDDNVDKINQNILILFGITFISTFILKSFSDGSSSVVKETTENVLTHATRAPF